jgi:hypothetical protein
VGPDRRHDNAITAAGVLKGYCGIPRLSRNAGVQRAG